MWGWVGPKVKCKDQIKEIKQEKSYVRVENGEATEAQSKNSVSKCYSLGRVVSEENAPLRTW
jgi:hypothetical protein